MRIRLRHRYERCDLEAWQQNSQKLGPIDTKTEQAVSNSFDWEMFFLIFMSQFDMILAVFFSYLKIAISYLLGLLRRERDKSSLFIALGLVCVAVGKDIRPHLDEILEVVSSSLPRDLPQKWVLYICDRCFKHFILCCTEYQCTGVEMTEICIWENSCSILSLNSSSLAAFFPTWFT